MDQALINHDARRRATDMPAWHGNKQLDTTSARLFLDRFAVAAEVAEWNNDERKIRNFYLLLRGRALVWWQQIKEDEDIDHADWNVVKQEFLAMYETKYTAKTTCANISELTQRQGEPVADFYLRVCEAFSKMTESKPAAMTTVRTNVFPAAAAGDVAHRETIKKEGINDAEKFFRHQLFLSGLHDSMRTKVLEAGKENIRESLKWAAELEVIHNRGRSGIASLSSDNAALIQAIDATGPDGDIPMDEDAFDEEEIAMINALRQRTGRPPFNRGFRRPFSNHRNGSGNNGRNNGSAPAGNCRYCKQPGHHQKQCEARIKAQAPMVDQYGKPFKKRFVNAVEGPAVNAVTAPPAQPAAAEHNVGAIVAGLNSLNW